MPSGIASGEADIYETCAVHYKQHKRVDIVRRVSSAQGTHFGISGLHRAKPGGTYAFIIATSTTSDIASRHPLLRCVTKMETLHNRQLVGTLFL